MSATPARGRNWGRWLALGGIDALLALVLAFGFASIGGAASANGGVATATATSTHAKPTPTQIQAITALPYQVKRIRVPLKLQLAALLNAKTGLTKDMRDRTEDIVQTLNQQAPGGVVTDAVVLVDCTPCDGTATDNARQEALLIQSALQSLDVSKSRFSKTDFLLQIGVPSPGDNGANVQVNLYVLVPATSTPAPTSTEPPITPTETPSPETASPSPTGAASPTGTPAN